MWILCYEWNEMERNILLAQRKESGAVGCNVDPGRKCHSQWTI